MMFVPHLRLSWTGTLPSGEIWSNMVSLVPDTSEWEALLVAEAQLALLTNLLTQVNMTDDLVHDVSNYHARPTSFIEGRAVMKRITLAAIDANGHYGAAPVEAAVNVGGGSGSEHPFPHQVSRKVTLETDSDLARIKGGFYQPCPSSQEWDPDSDLWSTNVVNQVRASVTQFMDDLNNAPGLDANAFRVVIASQGRHNKNGSVRQGPANPPVKRVNIGRRVDIQRRRANKLSEARISDAVLAP